MGGRFPRDALALLIAPPAGAAVGSIAYGAALVLPDLTAHDWGLDWLFSTVLWLWIVSTPVGWIAGVAAAPLWWIQAKRRRIIGVQAHTFAGIAGGALVGAIVAALVFRNDTLRALADSLVFAGILSCAIAGAVAGYVAWLIRRPDREGA